MSREDTAELPVGVRQCQRRVDRPRIVALPGVDRIRAARVESNHEPTRCPAMTANEAQPLLEIAPVGRSADPCRRFETVIVAPEDDVGDAAHRIGTVKGRGAVGDNFDPFDRADRNG